MKYTNFDLLKINNYGESLDNLIKTLSMIEKENINLGEFQKGIDKKVNS